MALTADNSPLAQRAAHAIMAYLATVPALAGVTFREANDPGDRPYPLATVEVSGLAQAWAGSEEFRGLISVVYYSGSNPDANADGQTAQPADREANRLAHFVAAAALGKALEAVSAIQAVVNAPATGRTATDFHLYALLDAGEDGTTHDGGGDEWETPFTRRIVCARVDYAT